MGLREIAFDGQSRVIILDCDPAQTAKEHLEAYKEFQGASVPVIVIADGISKSVTDSFLQLGAFACMDRPPSLLQLRSLIERACDDPGRKDEVVSTSKRSDAGASCDGLVGSSEKAQVVYDLINRMADLSAFVLIRGESGTGKELVARAIHNLSARRSSPFVAVSCGAIPETLIESELFGHEKGAFTGAAMQRAGYFEQAGDGTLLLDEIGELSLNTQVKLLRALQQRSFTRLGSNTPIPLRARILFATHRDLQQMVREGRFRQDLYFRVDVIQINVPALRERPEDIPALARHFLRKYSEEYGKNLNEIRPAAMQALVEYEWPGNVRELENAIQSAVVFADGNSIGRGDLPAHVQLLEEQAASQDSPDSDTFETSVRQFKIGVANRAVMECNGNKTLAARRLKVSRAYLHRLIRAEIEAEPECSEAAIA